MSDRLFPLAASPSAADPAGAVEGPPLTAPSPSGASSPLPRTESAPSELRSFAGLLAPWHMVIASWNHWHQTSSEGPAWILLRDTDAAKLDPDAWTQCAPLDVRSPTTARADLRDLVTHWAQLDTTIVTNLALQWIGVLLVLGPQLDGQATRLQPARFRPTSHPINRDLDVESRTANLLPRPLALGPGAWDELQTQLQQHTLLRDELARFFLRSVYTTPAPVFPDPSESPDDEDYGMHTWVHLGAIFRGFLRLSVITQDATGTPLPIVPWHRQQQYDGATWDVVAAMPDLWRRPLRAQLVHWSTQALADRESDKSDRAGAANGSSPLTTEAFALASIGALARSALAEVAADLPQEAPRLQIHPGERALMRHLLVSPSHADRELAVRALSVYGPASAARPDPLPARVP